MTFNRFIFITLSLLIVVGLGSLIFEHFRVQKQTPLFVRNVLTELQKNNVPPPKKWKYRLAGKEANNIYFSQLLEMYLPKVEDSGIVGEIEFFPNDIEDFENRKSKQKLHLNEKFIVQVSLFDEKSKNKTFEVSFDFDLPRTWLRHSPNQQQ